MMKSFFNHLRSKYRLLGLHKEGRKKNTVGIAGCCMTWMQPVPKLMLSTWVTVHSREAHTIDSIFLVAI
tara:strand:+ start:366 stop:572 length:207 start_codon:yes stop_codon:yes gene_type:complete